MDDSHTNSPQATAADPTSSPSDENLVKPTENDPVSQATTSTRSAQASVARGKSTATEIFRWITMAIVAQVNLPEDVAELVAFWVISTWFQDALTVFPLLAITGPPHGAMVVLRILQDLCRAALKVAEFKRSDFKDINGGCHTVLISEPYLDNRAAAFLGNLTNSGFVVVQQRSFLRCSASRAIYLGEDPVVKKIQHSIHINLAPTIAEPTSPPPEWIRNLPGHLGLYREKNVGNVRGSAFNPCGVPSETIAVAKALGACIVHAPKLQQKLVTLLKAQDQQYRSQQSGTVEALVVEAALVLSRQERKHAFTSEIAGEANRLGELRGERPKLKPETVGRQLCKLGLRTHRLTLAGNGLTFDKPTVALIEKLGTMYVEEDLPTRAENLHSSQTTENKLVEEVV